MWPPIAFTRRGVVVVNRTPSHWFLLIVNPWSWPVGPSLADSIRTDWCKAEGRGAASTDPTNMAPSAKPTLTIQYFFVLITPPLDYVEK
jgi:hypothetical protein